MNATIEVDASILTQRCNELEAAFIGIGKSGDAATVFQDEGLILAKKIVRYTPPVGLGTAARKQGEHALHRDLTKLFTPVNDDYLNEVTRQHGFGHLDTWITGNDGSALHIDWEKISLQGGGMKEFHHSHLNARGRVRGGMKKSSGAGLWKALFVVGRDAFDAYEKKAQSKVGRRKAGWLPMLTNLGGKAQKWIARHASGAHGYFINETGNKSNLSFTAANFSKGVSQDVHVVQSAVKIAAAAIKRRIKLVASGYAKDVAAGMRITNKAARTGGAA